MILHPTTRRMAPGSVAMERFVINHVDLSSNEKEKALSASETNIEKQAKRHRGPMYGIAVSLIWAAVLFVGFLIWTAYQSDNPTAVSPAEAAADN